MGHSIDWLAEVIVLLELNYVNNILNLLPV